MMVSIGSMDVMAVLSNTTNVIAEGEVQQLVNAKDPNVTEENYFQVIDKKTAILFSAASEVAAVIAGASPAQRKALSRYGSHLGIAFQLMDDALDYTGDAATLGKNVGDDLAEGKPTLPLIYAMRKGTPAQSELVAATIRKGDASQLPAILEIVQTTGGMDYTLDCAKQHVAQALGLLDEFPANAYTQAMQQLAEFSISRSF
jgi:octaprenyl-diphosphate synthase